MYLLLQDKKYYRLQKDGGVMQQDNNKKGRLIKLTGEFKGIIQSLCSIIPIKNIE